MSRGLRSSRVAIVGLARNCAKKIRNEIFVLREAFSDAEELFFIIIESDSTDDTVSALMQLSAMVPNFFFYSLGELSKSYPKRTERIAYCRNQYLRIVAEDARFSSVDYVVVADLDGVNSILTKEAVLSCWERSDWDVCTANQDGPYYDIWALRHKTWMPCDCWEQAKSLRCMGADSFQATYGSVYSKMIKLPRGAPWIEVDSAFGGLAVYKRNSFLASTYSGIDHAGDEVCEHVSFHRRIRELGGRIFINPKLINAGVVEHAKFVSGWGRVSFLGRCVLKDFTRNVSAVFVRK